MKAKRSIPFSAVRVNGDTFAKVRLLMTPSEEMPLCGTLIEHRTGRLLRSLKFAHSQ